MYTADASEYGAKTPPLPEHPCEVFQYRYDAQGRESECLYSAEGETVLKRGAAYDGAGRLSKVFGPGGLEREFGYHPDGSVSEMVMYDEETGDERRRFTYTAAGQAAAQTFRESGNRDPWVDYPDFADACYHWDAAAQDWIEDIEETQADGHHDHPHEDQDECLYDACGNWIERRMFDSEGELEFIQYQIVEYY